MSRGRTPNSVIREFGWKTVFYNSVGTYVQIINNKLSKNIKKEPLSNYIKILGGYSFKTSEYTKQGVPIIRISDFNNEKVNLREVVYYRESDELKKFELVEGDILIALTGGTIAKLGIVQSGLGKLYLNQRVGKFQILNPELFEKEFIYWIARSVQSIIKNLAWGAAIPNVSPRQIELLEFPIPDRKTQKGIVNFLNDLKNENINDNLKYFDSSIEKEILSLHEEQIITDNLIVELNHQFDILKNLRQQILQDAIQGKLVPQDSNDEPASILLEKIKAVKEKLIKEKKLKKSKPLSPINEKEIPFEIPKNWSWCKLENVSINRDESRVPVSKEERNIRAKIYDYYGASGVIDKIDGYTHEGEFLLIGEDGANLKAKSTPIAFIANGRFWVNNHAHVLEFYDKTLLDYMVICLNIIDISSFITGGFQPKLSQSNLNIIPVPIPPLTEQKRIVKKVAELLKVCDELEIELKQRKNLTQQLLQSALKEALEPKTN